MDAILRYDTDVVIDFNTDSYDFIRDDLSSYSDVGHLKQRGADKLLQVLNKHLETINQSPTH